MSRTVEGRGSGECNVLFEDLVPEIVDLDVKRRTKRDERTELGGRVTK